MLLSKEGTRPSVKQALGSPISCAGNRAPPHATVAGAKAVPCPAVPAESPLPGTGREERGRTSSPYTKSTVVLVGTIPQLKLEKEAS